MKSFIFVWSICLVSMDKRILTVKNTLSKKVSEYSAPDLEGRWFETCTGLYLSTQQLFSRNGLEIFQDKEIAPFLLYSLDTVNHSLLRRDEGSWPFYPRLLQF